MEGIQHKTVRVNGIDMHVAEKGEGPVVLFLHGFPQLWYSWRHQIPYVAANGYRAVAPDLRGYGCTTGAPGEDPTKFTIFHLVGDLIALLDAVAPEQEQVFVVAHDWGAIIAWFLCQCRPERVKGLVNISVHFLPRDPKLSFVEVFRGFYGDNHYVCRFQEPGKVEAEFAEIGVKEVIKKLFTNRHHGPLILPKGEPLGNSSQEVILPGWLSEEDVDFYAAEFEKTGFTGGINYYRALNLNWELMAPWAGAKVKVPVKFLVGDLDLVYHIPGAKEYIHNGGFQKDVPLLEEVVVMEGVGHYANQEKPDEVNKHILDFINKF